MFIAKTKTPLGDREVGGLCAQRRAALTALALAACAFLTA